MTMGAPERDPLAQLSLPPGFRFYPTDEELLVDYLCRKVAGFHFSLQIIGEIDLYKFDPWVLPSKAMFGEKEWYFFSPRDRKYPNGSRPNRVAGSGYWKATGTDKIITTKGRKVGIKKALVFYVGKAPKGTKTNWIMHEYRLIDCSQRNRSSKLDVWVLCRIYEKNSSSQQTLVPTSVSLPSNEHSNGSSSSSTSHLDELLESLPDMPDQFYALPRMNSLKTLEQDDKLNLQNLGTGNFIDWTNQTEFNTVLDLVQTGKGSLNYNINHNIDFYEPSLPQMREMEDEVQSVVRNQRGLDNATGSVQHNTNMLNQGFSNTLDPFGFRYPAQPVGFGFIH